MTSQDDLTLLKQMYQRGEISDEQYDVLRRHVLWGTPLPQLIDEVPAPVRPPIAAPAPRLPAPAAAAPPPRAPARPPVPAPRAATSAAGYEPDDPLTAPWRPDTGFVRASGRSAGAPVGAGSPPGPDRVPIADDPGSAGSAPTGGPPPAGRGGRPDDRAVRPPGGLPPPTGPDYRPGGGSRRRADAAGHPDAGEAAYRRDAGETAYRADAGGAAYRPDDRRRGSAVHGGDGGGPGLSAAAYPLETPVDGGGGGPRKRRAARSEAPSRAAVRREVVRTEATSRAAAARSEAVRSEAAQTEAPRREAVRSEAAQTEAPRREAVRTEAAQTEAPRREAVRTEPTRRESTRRDRGRRAVPERPDRPQPGRRRGRGRVAAGTSLLLALGLVAAGVWWFSLRETGVDAPTYARSVCGSVRDWQQGVDASSSALVKSIPREEDRSAVRTAVQRYYTDLAVRTDGLRAAVVGAGAVDVPGGRAYADSVAAAVGDQSAALRGLAARVGRLDIGAAAFQVSLQTLLTGAETSVSEITAALARPASGTPAQLRLALSAEPACAPYVG